MEIPKQISSTVGQGFQRPHVCPNGDHQNLPSNYDLYRHRVVWQDDPATIHRTAECRGHWSLLSFQFQESTWTAGTQDSRCLAHWECLDHPKVEGDGARAQVKWGAEEGDNWGLAGDRQGQGHVRLISSIPLCIQAVIDIDGRQITKEDY